VDGAAEASAALRGFDGTARHGLGVFCWFIYRIMTPALCHMLMNPTQRFRLQPAILSVLAGDVFRGTPLRSRLVVFKALYYLKSITTFGRSVEAWKSRRRSLAEASSGIPT